MNTSAIHDSGHRPAPLLAIVSPSYNEEGILADSLHRITTLIESMTKENLIAVGSYILIVDDGSKDRSWEIITDIHSKQPDMVKGIKLSRNCGHQNAILAGMVEVADNADAVITIDVDLQDDLMAIPRMVEQYRSGADVVYGVKEERSADPVLKRMSAQAFYRLQKNLGIDIIYNHSDFRLLSSEVVSELERYDERNLYLRGIVPMMGYRSAVVKENISERRSGKSKYTLRDMATLAIDGITGFSVKPLYSILTWGCVFFLITIGMAIYVLWSWISGNAEHGWASMMFSIWFVGAVIIFAVGVVGLYVGRIFIEVKHRPRYHIQSRL